MMEAYIFKAIITIREINKLSKIHQKRKSLENHEKSRIESSSIVVHFNCTLKLVEQLSI